jgi:hypothetical protein
MAEVSQASLRARTRRAFAIWGGGLLACIALGAWVARSAEDGGVQWPLRRVLSLNGRIWAGLFSLSRPASGGAAPARAPRVNGDVGLDGDFNPAAWAMQVDSPGHKALPALRLADLQWAPATETVTEFRCIEGWSEPISYSGLRFSDFLRHFGLGRRSGAEWPAEGVPDDLFAYVGLETPDQEYYVSIDMESMLHPQTVLAWAMNGQPLSLRNGAPLRLVIPVKYGIKSLKRVGRIFFADERPPDYWQEQGYDWFAGL